MAKRGISVQLATLVDEPPSGREWIHEQKFDGYRIVALRKEGAVRLLSRSGKDWTQRFPVVQQALLSLKGGDFALDGELCVLDRNSGSSSFHLLQRSFQEGGTASYIYFAFDLLIESGEDLRQQPLEVRKARLQRLLRLSKSRVIRFSQHTDSGGTAALRVACAQGWEGIISKLREAPYSAGRGKAWLKSKCRKDDDLAIAGYTESTSTTGAIGALLLALPGTKKGSFRYCGKVGTGFSNRQRSQLMTALKRLPPVELTLENKDDAPRSAHWILPSLIAQIAFTEWTSAGLLRHPAFLGLREDKSLRDLKPKRFAQGKSRGKGFDVRKVHRRES